MLKQLDLVCQYCGKKFTTNNKRRKFCNKECWNNFRNPVIEKPCKNCGELLVGIPHDIKKKMFCSYKCSGEWNKKTHLKKCKFCGEDFTPAPTSGKKNNRTLFCSRVCYGNQRLVDKLETTCTECGETIKTTKTALELYQNHFCNRKCMFEFNKKNPPESQRTPYINSNGKLWNMRSSWEVKFAKWLDSKGFIWEYEHRLYEMNGVYYIPDFWVNDFNCYIEVKGMYDDRSKIKVALFRESYPETPLVLATQSILELYGIDLRKKAV